MQKNAYREIDKKTMSEEIGKRIKQLRKNIKVVNNAKDESISTKNFLEELNSEHIDYCNYSIKDIVISYNKSAISKIESGIMLPSTDYIFLIHKYFNQSLDKLVFGHTLPVIEDFEEIYSPLSREKQEFLIDICMDRAEEIFKKNRDDESEQEEKFIDYRYRLNEVKTYSRLTNEEFCNLIGSSKNTVEKYHSTKVRANSKKYVEYRNSALRYLMKVCSGVGVSLDYMLEGTYYDENYPEALTEELRCYNYHKQVHILKLWLKIAKEFEENNFELLY